MTLTVVCVAMWEKYEYKNGQGIDNKYLAESVYKLNETYNNRKPLSYAWWDVVAVWGNRYKTDECK